MSKNLNLKLKIWRQAGPHAQGSFLEVDAHDIPEDASFLEMLDVVNERLIADDVEPVTFGHDCREGICGTCGVMINGQAHGPEKATATCQLHMRKFNDGDEIVIEPWQARSFPVLKDLMVDRRAFDRIVEAGGYISAPTGTAPDANEIPIPKEVADSSMDAAACIGCGACVAACPMPVETPVMTTDSMLFPCSNVAFGGCACRLTRARRARCHPVPTLATVLPARADLRQGWPGHRFCQRQSP